MDETTRHYAQYTEVFIDVLNDYPDTLDSLEMDTEAHTNAFKDMLINRFYDYEIAGETYGEFKEMLERRFGQIKSYYVELLDGYETKINMLDGRKTVREVSETKDIARSGNNSSHREGTTGMDSEETVTDLPRSTASENRPTSKTADTADTSESANASGQYSDTGKDTITRSATVTGIDTQADLKKKYLELIRNVYKEMAEEMKPCFLTLFF